MDSLKTMENISEMFSNPAVVWFIIGLALLLGELVLPGLIVLFFGIGGWIVSLMLLFAPDISLNTQLLIFIISSLLSLALLRRSLKKWIDERQGTKSESVLEEYVGKKCVSEADFKNGTGKVTFKGALWEAKSDEEVKKGDSLIITEVDSIRLIVKPI